MPKSISARTIDTLNRPGRHAIDNGLYLCISKTGRKSWVFRYQRHGKRRDAGLGPYPAIGLAEARRAAFEARGQLAEGLDPIHQRQAKRKASQPLPTFEQIAAKVIDSVGQASDNEKNRYRAQLLLGEQYCETFLTRPVNSITAVDVARLLNAVGADKPETARKLHGLLNKVFESARVILRSDHDIALGDLPTNRWDLKSQGYQPRVVNRPYPALDWREAPQFMAALRLRTGIAYRALEFTVLTGMREGAVASAEWTEIDFQTAIWTVPLIRLKDRRHRTQPLKVPLSTRSVEILMELSGLDRTWVFPGRQHGQPIAAQSMLQALKVNLNKDADGAPIWRDPDSHRPIVVHGMRAMLKTYADDQGFRFEVSELSLGHAVGGSVERRYRRTDLLEDRRRFLQAWSDHCSLVPGANVVALRS